jgi:hypothetical protein
MKRIILVLFFLIIPNLINSNVSQFKTTFTITYNSITLEEAAKFEKEIRKQHKEACNVDIRLSKASSDSVYVITLLDDISSSTIDIYPDTDNLNTTTLEVEDSAQLITP